MKGINKILIMLVLMGILTSCSQADEKALDQQSDANAIVQGNNDFALELYARLRPEKGNLFFSPYSISTALAMVYTGACSRTQEQMAKTLHFPTLETEPNQQKFHSAFGKIIQNLNARSRKGNYELTVANALWGQKSYSFLDEFLELVEAKYGGGMNKVDFVNATETTRKKINTWVEKETNNKIKNLIGKGVLGPATRLVLTNAIYFKGNWASQFKKERTRNKPFTPVDGNKTDVPMMKQTEDFKYMEAKDFQAIELPYVDDELSMVVFLPKKIDGLCSFEKELTLDNLSKWLTELRKRKVIVYLPKFKMTRQIELAETLSLMGMPDAFSTAADFSGMTGTKELFISAVIHKAYVEVNEEGTEAAAATGIGMKLTSVEPVRPPVFRADHPFLFLIRDNLSGAILFIGRVMNPKI